MSTKYAKDCPPGFVNSIRSVAIVGAGGRVGGAILDRLLKHGKHDITAVTRAESTSVLPDGVKKAVVDYDSEDSLVAALRGHDFFIISLAVTAAPDTEATLIRGAAKAGVPYVMPNWWGCDPAGTSFIADTGFGAGFQATLDLIHSLGMISISLTTGFWYEFSLVAGSYCYGFDLDNRALTLFDDGETPISTTTFALIGKAVAALLSLPRVPESAEEAATGVTTLADYTNGSCFVSSFYVSQKEMFESVKRVTSTSAADWTVTKENSQERYAAGAEKFKSGDREGFGIMLYTRAFFPGREMNFEDKLSNQKLGLPKEDLDEVTKAAIEGRKRASFGPYP